MKIFFRRIHLYLGLASGLVIMSCCLTGALLVFQKELEQAFHKERYFTEKGERKLSLDTLVAGVKKSYPQAKVNLVKIYASVERTVEVNISIAANKANTTLQKQASKKVESGVQQRAPSLTAFVDPYTGKIVELYNSREGFFYNVMALHRWLLGSNNGPGKFITGVATFIFLFILITGIILWWPKTKKILAQRLKVKSTVGWKRLNHDLHIVLGFYSAIFLFVFAFTALAWSFEWFNKGIYKVTSSSMKPPEPPSSALIENTKTIGFDLSHSIAKTKFRDKEFYTITTPKDSLSAIAITGLSTNAVHETATDVLYLNQYSGEVVGQYLYSDRNIGAKVRAAFRPVHVGSIWGLPSKIIALIVCLLGTSFPVTGVILWLNRTRKKKRKLEREMVEA
jgi:uncharacterized iron-regulated membrane protein